MCAPLAVYLAVNLFDSIFKSPIWADAGCKQGDEIALFFCRAEPTAAAVAWLLGASMRPSRKVATLLYRWVRSKRKVAAKKAAARKARARASARRQKNLLLLVAALAEEEQAASQPGKRVRAVIARAEQGWKGSVMYGYLYNQTAATKPQVYKANFRMAPQTVKRLIRWSARLKALG